MNSFFYKTIFLIKDNIVNILRSMISSFGILFLVCFFVIYLAIRDSVTTYISGSLLDNLASNEIKILPKNAASIEFVKKPGSKAISAETLRQIKKMPEFSEITPLSRTGFNVRISAELMGKSKMMYVPVCGIDKSLLKKEIKTWKSFDNRRPVPVIIPGFAIDIMNNFFALEGLPTIDQKEFIGFPVNVRFNTGQKRTPEYKEYNFEAEIHSFTDLVNFPGLLLPTDFLIEISEKYRQDTKKSAGLEYIVIYAKVKDTDKLPVIVSKLKKLGLKVESQKDIIEKTQKTMKLIDGVFFAIMSVFFIVSVISIFNSYLTIVYIRSQKFSLKRVLGFSKLRILVSFIVEAGFIGALYGIAGYFAGNYILAYSGDILAKWVPVLSAVKLQSRGGDVLLMCISISSSICAASALVPAIFASNMNLFKAVRK